jgi:thioredoxin reductase
MNGHQAQVAIVGAGPGGLVAAKWLKQYGFEPVIFEQSDDIGGQWNAHASHSGVWSSMRANTSRLTTSFSDLQYEPGTSVFPSNQQVHAYLQRYVTQFELDSHLRLGTQIKQIGRATDNGWAITFVSQAGELQTESFPYVVIASGRNNKPMIPSVLGLDSFSGAGGIIHTFEYKDPDRYRGQRVLVGGGSISALEIASDLANLGATRVVSANRRQHYILHKILAGVPTSDIVYTRFAALAAESMPLEVIAQELKNFVVQTSGSPEQFGAPKPADNIFEAGLSQSQQYLPLVAEGRITTKPWIRAVEGQMVHFTDDTKEEIDAMIFGTGYTLHLPFLSQAIRQTLNLDTHHLDLHKFTFHPDLPGLAFLGLFKQPSPYFPILELQARWLTYVWSNVCPTPSRVEMDMGLAMYRARRGQPQEMRMHDMALLFAREAGVEPDLYQWSDHLRALLFGPLSATSFRLSGPDSLPDAAQRFAEEAIAFGAVPSPQLKPEQQAQLKTLAAISNNSDLARLINQVKLTEPVSI